MGIGHGTRFIGENGWVHVLRGNIKASDDAILRDPANKEGTMPIKLIASIVAISGIHLLKIFMDIKKYTESEVMWMVIIHLVFVASGVMLALMDFLVSKSKALNYKN